MGRDAPSLRQIGSLVRRWRGDVRGNIAILFGLALLPMTLAVGASVDYARVITAQSGLQNALDAAVLAGANAPTGSQTAVAQHALDGALGNWSITYTANFVANSDGSVNGTASASVPMTLMRVAQIGSRPISATAKAALVTSGPPTNVCILIKDPASSQTLLVNSNVTINAPACEIDVASTGGTAAMINNGSGIAVASLCVASSSVTTNGTAPANLKTSCRTATDPFAGTLPTVAVGSCTVSNQNYAGTTSLSPGVYCGNFNFNGSGTLNMAPGLYVLKGTRWNLNSGWTVSGAGVTLYFADANSDIQVNSGVAINISAPTSGTYANILIFEPVGLPTSSFSINGSAGHSFTGLLYLPSRNVTFNSVSSISSEAITMVFNQLILDTINWKFGAGALSIMPVGSSANVSGVRLVN